jgi:outer membrane receptor protein involved in Fe transport
MRKLPLFALAVTTSLFAVDAAYAQIEEIVVTTRKREENLQNVPIVVTAFTAANIERKGIVDLADIAKYTSGVFLDEGFSKQDTRVVIRGLSPTRGRQNVAILQDDVDISSLAQTSAGGSFVINPRLLDVERIEVIKGPHSALYGRSAFNGAINYITKKPGNEFQGNVQLDIGSYGKQEGRISVSGPVINDKLAIGVNAEGWNFNGFYRSAVTGAGLGGGDGGGGAGTMVFTPTDALKFTLRSEYSKDNFAPEARTMKNPTPAAIPPQALALVGAVANPANATFLQTYGSLGHASDFGAPAPSRNPRTGQDYPGTSRELFRNTLRTELNTEYVNFTALTHYGDNREFQFNDALQVGDLTVNNGGQETFIKTKIKLFSQEIRAQSAYQSRLQWTVGGLYWYEIFRQVDRNLRCSGPTGGCATVFATIGDNLFTPDNQIRRNTRHLSAFALLDFEVIDNLKVSGEVRYTSEKERTSGFSAFAANGGQFGCPNVTVTGRAVSATGVVTCVTPGPLVTGPLVLNTATSPYRYAEVPSSYWTPRITVDYKIRPDFLVYASAAEGKKPAGNSTLGGLASPPNPVSANYYDPEQMWVYEIGAKSSWLDNRLVVNGALYYQDYSKKQVSITFVDPNSTPPNQLSLRTVNAAKARVKGLELEVQAAPTDNLSFNLSYTYNDAQYKDFTDLTASATAISRAAVRNPNSCTIVTVGNPPVSRCQISYAGYDLEGAPRHSLQLGGEVRGDITADLGWFVDSDVRYNSKRYTTFENSLVMEPYWLVDMRIGLKTKRFTITAYVNNLFDDDTMKASAVYVQNWNLAFLTNTGRTPISAQSPSAALALLPDKRQFGIRGSYNF